MKSADRGAPCVRPRPRPKRTETRQVVFYAARLLIGPVANAPSWLDAPRYRFLSGHAAVTRTAWPLGKSDHPPVRTSRCSHGCLLSAVAVLEILYRIGEGRGIEREAEAGLKSYFVRYSATSWKGYK